MDVDCSVCHGSEHTAKDDFAKAKLPTPDTCAQCHDDRVAHFKKGKHAFAWAAAKAMPTFHYQPVAIREGLKGCGGCHKLGLKSETEQRELAKVSGGFGNASCDACHTRHLFSRAEARRPEACQTCHAVRATARAIPVLCVHGTGEHESLCPRLADLPWVTNVLREGGHHLHGDEAAGLARQVLDAAR